MKILKEEISDLNSYSNCKEAYRTLAQLTESDFKRLVSLKPKNVTQKNISNDSIPENDITKSNDIKSILRLLASMATKTDDTFPKKQCKFLTDYYNKELNGTFDFGKLVKDSNFNLLRVRGMLAALMFKSVSRSLNTYYRFLSLFSPTFAGNDNIKNLPDDVSFIILNSFTEAFGINNISKTNKFIKDYVNSTYFDNYTPTREVFEKVYNDYVSNPSFNIKKIFSGEDSSKEDNKEIII